MKLRNFVALMVSLVVVLPRGVVHSQAVTFTRWFGGSKYDEAFCARCLHDGGYLLVGTSFTLTNRYNEVFVVRMNSMGDTAWTRTIGRRGDDDGFSACETFDAGYAIAGTKSSRPADTVWAYIVRLDSAGTESWTKTLRQSLEDRAMSICETRDSGLAVAGIMGSGPYGRSDAWLIRMNRSGDTLWTKTYGGVGDDGLYSILLLPDNGFLLTGCTNSFSSGSFDEYVIRTNAAGDTLWSRIYGSPDNETGWSADAVGDSGFVIGGIVTHGMPPASTSQFYLVRIGENGDTLWTKTIDGATNQSRCSVRHTRDGGFAFVGTTFLPDRDEDAFLVKTDRWGETQWWRSFGQPFTDHGSFLEQCPDGGFVIAGMVAENTFDAYIVKTDEAGLVTGIDEGSADRSPMSFHLFQNYPNPFNPTTRVQYTLSSQERDGVGSHVSLKVYDILGCAVATVIDEVKPPGTYTVTWDARGMASGVYYYRLEAEGKVEVRKMLLMK